jgi:hypothetical protein
MASVAFRRTPAARPLHEPPPPPEFIHGRRLPPVPFEPLATSASPSASYLRWADSPSVVKPPLRPGIGRGSMAIHRTRRPRSRPPRLCSPEASSA